ncbi:MAG: FAD-dependent oxidoreductase [Saccharospirillum sp.]|nr:FAD-dependent oxidoreductase [Saccharospirillum sp.]
MTKTGSKAGVGQVSRRDLVKLGMAAGAVAAMAPAKGLARTVNARGHIVIVGAGAGGISLANRLVQRLPNARITIVDGGARHVYQPGLTLVASGLWASSKLNSTTQNWLPSTVDWKQAYAEAFEPDLKQVRLSTGEVLSYDFLVVATGLQVNYDEIEGFSANEIGSNGIGCVYDTPEHAVKTNQMIEQWMQRGEGAGVFTLAPTPIKCAGAPLKMCFTTLSRLEARPDRDRFDVHFYVPGDRVFGIDYYNTFVKERWQSQGVIRHDFHRLVAVDGPNRKATFQQTDGTLVTQDYGFLHVVPPMSAPDALRDSDLVWWEGPFAGNWLEVDQHTMQHRRYPEVFGLGDVIGAPVNKTAASVKMQVPVVEENLLAVMQGQAPQAQHNGYTSCPLITGIGKAMLVEFGYGGVLLPSFPFIDPKEESWAVWIMKDRMLQPAYYAMLDGKI